MMGLANQVVPLVVEGRIEEELIVLYFEMLVLLADSALPEGNQLFALGQRSHGYGPLFESNRHRVSNDRIRFVFGGGMLLHLTGRAVARPWLVGAPSEARSLEDDGAFDKACDRLSQARGLNRNNRIPHWNAVPSLVDWPIGGPSGNLRARAKNSPPNRIRPRRGFRFAVDHRAGAAPRPWPGSAGR
jgi:hypothetical protein